MPLDPLNDPLLRAPRSHAPTIAGMTEAANTATPEQLADFVDAIGASGGGGGRHTPTDLGATATPTGVTVTSSTGADALLPLATATNAGLVAPAQHAKLADLPTAAALATDQAAQDLEISGKAPATHTHTPAAIGAATAAQGAKADTALQPGVLPAGTTLPAAQISDATTAGRALLTAADASAQRTALALGNVSNTADADKPVSTAQALAIAAATTADALAGMLEAAPAADLERIQASVSGGAPTVYRVTTPYHMIGTGTARQEFGRINIPQAKLPAGAYIKGWVQFAGTRNAASKTHIIGVNDAGGGLYGCVDIFNAALTTANYAGNRVEFWLRIQNTDSVEAGLYGSSSGLGPVSSSAAVNPVLAEINLRGGGLDIAFGGNLAAPVTGTVSISQAAPGVVSWTAHGCVANQPVSFSAPPAPLVANRLYYVVSGSTLLTDSFTVAEIRGGPAITTTAAAASITGTAYTEFGIVDAHVEVTA